MFWDSQGVLLTHFQKHGKNMNSASYCEVLVKLGIQFTENVQANWQEGYCFIMTMPYPIQPKQPRREYKNYKGNFLDIALQPDLAPRDFHLFGPLKTALVAKVFLMMKRLK
jgi:hypothetical protein